MNTFYLRNEITEGQDKGYGECVEPTMKEPTVKQTDDYTLHQAQWNTFNEHIRSLPGILVHPSYLENHKVGWMQEGDWEERKQFTNGIGIWIDCTDDEYNNQLPHLRRNIIIPRTSHVEDAGEVKGEIKCGDLFTPLKVFGYELMFVKNPMMKEGQVMASPELLDKLKDFFIQLAATHPTQGEDKTEEARFHAVEFADWIVKEGWVSGFDGRWTTYSEDLNTEELYKLFLTNKPQIK